MLLAADEQGERWTDGQICETDKGGRWTIERRRQRFVEEGFAVALKGKPREVFKEKVLDGAVEARFMALRGSAPPDGRARGTLQ